MGKAILFVLGCAAWTLGVVVLTVFMANSGWRGIELQTFISPRIWWATPLSGAIVGIIVAMANLLGPWPRLAWRKLGLSYALLVGLPFITLLAPMLWMRWMTYGDPSIVSFGTYVYFQPEPSAGDLMLLFGFGMGAVVVFFRIRKHRKATRAAQVL